MKELEVGEFGFIAGKWPLDPGLTTLLFIHGAGGSSMLWPEQVSRLGERANTLALDLPGHGRSRGPGRSKVSDYADAVVDFIGEAGAPRVVPVGLSMGGAITQQLLLDHPGVFPAAVLVSTGSKLRVLPQIFETIDKDFAGFIKLMGKFSASPKTPPEVLKPVLDDTARCDPRVAYNDFTACDAFNVMPRLGEIDVPVLVVTGEDDMLTPCKYGEFIADNLKWSKRVHLADCGHMVPVEKPDELIEAISGFMDDRGL